jgi:metallo-beta-lactamase family protein
MELTFLGATGTVTGSRYLIRTARGRVLVDCGLFQGLKELRMRNWKPLPVRGDEIDAVVLTHAHIDHSGTCDLLKILLPDAGHLQEEEAEFANRRGFSKHKPALPLYTEADARECLGRLVPLDFGARRAVLGQLEVEYSAAGHILGAACAHLHSRRGTLVFTGDVGSFDSPTMKPPAPLSHADWLVVESTYGDRRRPRIDVAAALAEVVTRTVSRGGSVLLPAFAVGRTQTVLQLLAELLDAGRIPDVPVFLDSPMAIAATKMFCDHTGEHRLSPEQCERVSAVARYMRTVEESKSLDRRGDSMILISASGMASGGRVLHHLKAMAPEARNTILFVGYQAAGTRGQALVGGAEQVKIHGEYVPVRAEVVDLEGLSAHADFEEIGQWLTSLRQAPRRVFVTHGEPAASDAMRRWLTDQLGWTPEIPVYGQRVRLDGHEHTRRGHA